MTRLPTNQNRFHRPASVSIGELAIAAGMAGYSLGVCYRDYSAPVLCELWRHYASSLAANEVHHVRTPAEARKLGDKVGIVRLALVHAPRLHSPAAWAIRMALPGGEPTPSCPAMFTGSSPDDLDDDPGATLVLQGNPDESGAIMHWLLGTEHSLPDWANVRSSRSIQPDPVLQPVLCPRTVSNPPSGYQYRDQLILRGLLVGACLLRSSRERDQGSETLTISLDDYALVRRLLRTELVCPTDKSCDPLTVDMVNRTNIYLAVKYGPEPAGRNPFYADDDDRQVHSPGGSPGRDLVTRREIADLGNIRSRTVRRLVEYLRGRSDGYDQFRRMGFRRRPPTRDEWRRASAGSLALQLRTWSHKQVRSHFDRLHKAKLITAARERGNAPWQYRLPEELSDASSPFCNLPPAQQLHGDEPDATGNAEM